jgi:hypothetical protein
VCGKRIDTELDGVACLECAIFFHDACALARKPEASAADTERTAAARKRKKSASRIVPCPWCGVDARKAHRALRASLAAERDAIDEDRRVAIAARTESGGGRTLPLRLGISLCLFAAVVLLRVCAHR